MKKRVLVAMLAGLLPLCASAWVSSQPFNKRFYISVPDTIAKQDTAKMDLEDLENMLPDSVLETKQDTVMGIPRPKGYNGLRFVLDKRHRYAGDQFVDSGFLSHTYVTLGGGVSAFLPNDKFDYTPIANLHVGIAKELSPMSTIRLFAEKSWGFTKAALGFSSVTTYSTWGGGIDYLFNFSNYLMGNRPDRPLNVLGTIGVGVQTARLNATENTFVPYYAENSALSYNARFGMQFKIMTSPHASLAFEPYLRLATRTHDLVKGTDFESLDLAYGINMSYIWYLWPNLSSERDKGSFLRRFNDNERFFLEEYMKKPWRKPFFFEYSIGAAFHNRTNLPIMSTLGWSSNVYMGWWLSSAIGLRAGFHVSNADWADRPVRGDIKTRSMIGTRGVVLDMLFNPLGFKRGYDWDSNVGFNLFAGYEYGQQKLANEWHYGSYSGNYVGYRTGAQVWLKLCNDLRLNVEPSYSFMELYNAVNERKQYDEIGLKLGLAVLFRDKAHREKLLIPVDSVPASMRMSPNRGFFIGMGFGWNTMVRAWRYTGGDDLALKNAEYFAGYNFDPFHGFRLSAEYLGDRIHTLNELGNGLNNENLQNMMLSLDYQFNIMNAFAGYNPYRRWNVYLYGGPTWARGDARQLAFNFGGMLTYSLTSSLALFYNHTVYRMPKGRYENNQIYGNDGTYVNSLNVGVLYTINQPIRDVLLGISQLTKSDYSRQPLTFEYSVGPSWYNNLPISTGSSLGYTANTYLGLWLNSAIGMRGGVHISNADWFHDLNEPRKNQLGLLAGTVDLMFNPLGIRGKYDWNMPVGFNLFMGTGLGKIRFVTSRMTAYETKFHEFRMGAQLWMKMTDDLRFNVEPTFSRMRGFEHGRVAKHVDELALKLGVSMILRDKADKDKTIELDSATQARVRSPHGLFFGGGFGWNTTVHTWRHTGRGFDLLKNGLLFAGYNFNEYHGVRLGGEYLYDYVWNDYNGPGIYEKQEFKNTMLSLDYQFNILNAIAGVRPGRRWEASLYLGPSLALGEKGTDLGWNFGGILSYQLTKELSVFYSHTVYRMEKNRYKTAQVYRTPGTYVNSLNVGIIYNMSGSLGDGVGSFTCDYEHKPVIFEYNVGPTWFNGLEVSRASSMGFTANANLGWWLNSALGVRGGIHVSNADWTNDASGEQRYLLRFYAGTLDLMFNPFGFQKKYDWNSTAGLNLFAGAGTGNIRFVTGQSSTHESKFNEWRLGTQIWLRLADNLRFNIEPTYSLLRGFEKVQSVAKTDELSLKFGLSLLLGKKLANKEDVSSSDASQIDYNPANGFYVAAGGGWNTTIHTWRTRGQETPFFKNALLFFGYRFGGYHGVRVSAEFMQDKVWEKSGAILEKKEFENKLYSLDYNFHLLNAIAGINPARRYDVSLYLGPSYVQSKAGNGLAWNLGGIISYNVSSKMALFYSHTIYRMDKKHYQSSQIYTKPGAIVNSLNVGLQYKF